MPTKKIKMIKIDADKCSGCRLCEAMCAAYHTEPKFASTNPHRSRIRVFRDEENALYYPVMAGSYAEVECPGRYTLTIKGKKYNECSFCRTACPSREIFKEPDTQIPLKCDMCGEPPPEGGPMCVQACMSGALTYVEKEVEDRAPVEAQTP